MLRIYMAKAVFHIYEEWRSRIECSCKPWWIAVCWAVQRMAWQTQPSYILPIKLLVYRLKLVRGTWTTRQNLVYFFSFSGLKLPHPACGKWTHRKKNCEMSQFDRKKSHMKTLKFLWIWQTRWDSECAPKFFSSEVIRF